MIAARLYGERPLAPAIEGSSGLLRRVLPEECSCGVKPNQEAKWLNAER